MSFKSLCYGGEVEGNAGHVEKRGGHLLPTGAFKVASLAKPKQLTFGSHCSLFVQIGFD